MKLDYSKIGRNIRSKRNKLKISQADLAHLVDITPQHMSHIECNKTKLSLSVLVSISDALSTDINILLGSNVRKAESSALAAELSKILNNATSSELRLCITLCRDVIEHSSDSQ